MRRRSNRSWSKLWTAGVMLGLEAQMVVALRLAKLSWGANAKAAKSERRRMVGEKIKALGDAQRTVVKSVLRGSGHRADVQVVRLYRTRVRANLKRLAKGR